MFDKLKAYLMIWKLTSQATKEVEMNNISRPGWKTTEFWVLGVLPQVPTVVGLFLGSTNPITLAVGAACAIAYGILRTTNKTAVAKAVIMAGIQAGADAAKSADVAVVAEAIKTQ